MNPPPDGLHPNVPEEDYFAWDAYSNSLGKILRTQTPQDARESMLLGSPSTPAMAFGSAMHIAIGEPKTFKERVVGPLMRDDVRVKRQSNADKALWIAYEKESAGKIILDEGEIAQIEAIAKAVRTHPVAGPLSTGAGLNEVSIVWTCQETGVRCKGRLDRLTMWGEYAVVVDWKSTEPFSPGTPFKPQASGGLSLEELKKVASRFGYSAGAWHYLDGANSVAAAPRRFLFVFVAKVPKNRPGIAPKVRVVEANAEMLEIGRHQTMKARALYQKCVESGEWPGWEPTVELLGATSWDMRAYEQALDQELE